VTKPDVEILPSAYGTSFRLAVGCGLRRRGGLVGRAVLDGRGAPPGSWDYYLLASLAVLAMGLQNAPCTASLASRSTRPS
jgi:hypothetical protein